MGSSAPCVDTQRSAHAARLGLLLARGCRARSCTRVRVCCALQDRACTRLAPHGGRERSRAARRAHGAARRAPALHHGRRPTVTLLQDSNARHSATARRRRRPARVAAEAYQRRAAVRRVVGRAILRTRSSSAAHRAALCASDAGRGRCDGRSAHGGARTRRNGARRGARPKVVCKRGSPLLRFCAVAFCAVAPRRTQSPMAPSGAPCHAPRRLPQRGAAGAAVFFFLFLACHVITPPLLRPRPPRCALER
jgi:hypothetical protein